MFVPAAFRVSDVGCIADVVDRHALALAVSSGDPVPFATHLPAIRSVPGAPPASLEGTRILGHMNRANPHWAALRTGDAILLVFQGPSSYITPTVYGGHPAAPTWNFVAVHVRGRLALRDRGDPTLEVVRATVAHLESTLGDEWDMTPSLEYFRRILPGVGAFEVEVDAVDAQFKLSQDQSAPTRRHIADDLGHRAAAPCRGVADLMRDPLVAHPPGEEPDAPEPE